MIKVISINENEIWDEIVKGFANYDVYYLSGYVKAFRIHGDGEPLLFYYEGDGLRGINVVMKRDISKAVYFTDKLPVNTWFDFATPYGYGGWIIEGNGDKNKLFKDYENWCRINNVVSEFVRFHPMLKNHAAAVAYDVIPLGETVVMNTVSPEIIWDNIISKNRNVIRKAVKNGVHIFNGRCDGIFETFHKIYNKTMDKDNADDYYYFDEEFYKSILMDLPYNSQIFYAELGGKVIAAAIMLMANGKMSYHLSGLVKEYQNLAPTNLLLYQAALWGNANGCKSLHLGGGVGAGEDSLFRFKKAFYRGELQRFYIGRKIFIEEKYKDLTTMKEVIDHNEYFPQYRG